MGEISGKSVGVDNQPQGGLDGLHCITHGYDDDDDDGYDDDGDDGDDNNVGDGGDSGSRRRRMLMMIMIYNSRSYGKKQNSKGPTLTFRSKEL